MSGPRGRFNGDLERRLFEGPIRGKESPILWPPRLPHWWGEFERRIATRYVKNEHAPYFSSSREDFRAELYEKQAGMCHWCDGLMSMDRKRVTPNGRVKDNSGFATFEHLIPKSNGGTFDRKNIVLAHGGCNNKRARRKFPHDKWLNHDDLIWGQDERRDPRKGMEAGIQGRRPDRPEKQV